jgi:hypothetical protein
MTLCRAVQSVLVVPDQARWGAQALGPGSILDVEVEPTPSVLGIDEVRVRWVDVIGREVDGWISQVAMVEPLRNPSQSALLNVREDLRVEPFDRLRHLVRQQQLNDPKGQWTMASWLRILGDAHIHALAAAVRELGGIIRGTENHVELSRRILRLAVNQEHLMTTDTHTVDETEVTPPVKKAKKAATKPAPAKTTAKKSATKPAPTVEKAAKSPRKSTAESGSASQRLGESLVKLLKRAGGSEAAQAIATKMAEGKTATAKQLTQLRDGINEAAGVAREKEKGELASELSAANRNVRRLARSAASE